MKRLCLIFILLLSVTMSGCGVSKDSTTAATAVGKDSATPVSSAGQASTAISSASAKPAGDASTAGIKYDLSKVTYTDQDVKINYPQINNLSDGGKQQKINELLKTSALEVLNDYQDSLSSLRLDMDYQIKYQGADFLSIEYLGLATVKGTAHPNNLIQTTNIDLQNGKLLALSDVVTVNDSLVKEVKAGQYKPYGPDLDLEAAGALKDVLDGITGQDLLESLKQQTAKYYLTKNSLGVSIETSHAVGDHLELEMPYSSLNDLLLIKP